MINELLEVLKLFCLEVTSNYSLPVAIQKGDTKQEFRPPKVFKMRLPNAASYAKFAPYIIVQYITGKDVQREGNRTDSSVDIRFIFAVYDENEECGAVSLVNVMESVRIALLKKVVIGGKFKLDKASGLETIVYPQDTTSTGPYYAGEMAATFMLPSIEREVDLLGKENCKHC